MPSNLHSFLQRATREHWAIAHFNVSNLEQMRGVCEAAKECSSPLMVGTSEGEAHFIGRKQAVALIRAFREELGAPLFLNADHHKSVASAKEAIDADYDSVHIDLSALPFEENLAGTREVVAYARQQKGDAVDIEGEVGYFVTESSKRYDRAMEIPPESLAKPEEAERLAKESGVNRLAIAVGNSHGIAPGEPQLDFERITAIRARVPGEVALVLHGGSGIPDADIKQAIACGIANVHISTELRIVFSDTLRLALIQNPEETTPYKLFADVIIKTKEKAAEKLRVLGSCGRVS